MKRTGLHFYVAHPPRKTAGAMMEAMVRRVSGVLGMLVLAAGSCAAQTPGPAALLHYIEIKLPPEVVSDSFFVRYVLAGERFGGWAKPLPGVSSYFIGTTLGVRPATGIKAVLYAPGCAVRTLDLRLSASENPPYSFTCQPLRSIAIRGAVIRSNQRLHGHDVKLQARYIARWAEPFLGVDDSIVTGIPVGDVESLPADGHFRLAIPDLSQDPLAGAPGHPGELQIWAKDKTSDAILAELVPTTPPSLRTRMGGMKMQSEYPDEIAFALCAPLSREHDSEGFAIRPDVPDACDH